MIRMWAVLCVEVLDVHDLPGGFTGLQEDVIQAVTEERATPRPADLMRGGMSMLMDLTEGIQPGRTDVFDLVRMFGSIKVTGNDRGTP